MNGGKVNTCNGECGACHVCVVGVVVVVRAYLFQHEVEVAAVCWPLWLLLFRLRVVHLATRPEAIAASRE